MNLVYFLGRFHVLALHLPITLVIATVLLDWLSRREKYRQLEPAVRILWAATAVSAILTVALGYMHFSEGGFTGYSAKAHRFLGTSVAIVTTTVWMLRSYAPRSYRASQLLIGVAMLALITVTGHFGGNLTHGDTYLVQFAPAPLRKLVGLEAARPAVKSLALADPYLDVVRPIFSQRCFTCHNDDKQRGRLNLSKIQTVLKGGKDGPVIVPGSLKDSDLYRRISLPQGDKDVMPAEGKTPLTADQVAIIGWWIKSGAKSNTQIGSAAIPADITRMLTAQLGLGGSTAGGAALEAAAAVKADPKILERLTVAGFLARQNSASDVHLIVSALSPGSKITDEQIAALQSSAENVLDLNLQRAGINDAQISKIALLKNLARLRLNDNQITDHGVEALASLPRLEYLNLFGNTAITDKSVDSIAKLAALKEVYLWSTGVTPAGAAKLRERKPELRVDIGAEQSPTPSVGDDNAKPERKASL